MKIIRITVLLLITIFLFFSCQDSSFLSGSSNAEIMTLEDGIVLTVEEEIPIEVFFEEEPPTSFSITLVDNYDSIRGEVTLEGDALSIEIPPLELPDDLDDGYYRLNLKLFNGEEIMTDKTLPFFIFQDQPRIQGIISYPLVFHPGGRGLVFLETYIPEGLDPWIRWRFNEEIIYQGLLSEGLDKVMITAPETTGIYTLGVEMVPVAPKIGEEWDFISPLREETLIYVNEVIEIGENGLDQPGSYYSLFHFQGEYNDWGERDAPMILYTGNEPELDVKQGVFGYRMGTFDTFQSDSFLFPVSDEGKLQPFSLFLIFALEEVSENCQFLETAAPGFKFRFFTDEAGIPLLNISGDEGEFTFSLEEPFGPGVYNPVIISIFPDYDNEELTLLWYLDGELAAEYTGDWVPAEIGSDGSTSIGGVSGGTAIMDELGIYYKDTQGRPAPAPNIFQNHYLKLYGNRLYFADGFDSLDLREELQQEAGLNQGRSNLLFGQLEMEQDARFSLPGLPGENGTYKISLSAEEVGEAVLFLEFREETEEGLAFLGEKGLTTGKNEVLIQIIREEGILMMDEEIFFLSSFPPEQNIAKQNTSRILMSLSNRGEKHLYIQNILILKELLRLVDQEKQEVELSLPGRG